MKTKTIEEFLSDLCSLDVKLWIEDNRLRCSAPKDVLTSVIKQELAERKQDILAFIRNNNVTNGSEQQLIGKVPRQGNLPLSFAQQRLWFLAQLEPDSPFYNIPGAVRLKGQLNVEALQQSFNEIIRRHEALRSNFQTIEGEPVTVISEEKSIKLSILDISSLSAFEQEAEVKQQAAQEAQQPFDISSDHLLRVKLLRLEEQEHIVLLTMHHIVSDGWSLGVLVQELATFYKTFCNKQPSPLPELPIHYLDFAAWQRQWLQGEVLETQISYWLKQLESAPKVLELPTDQPRPAIQTFHGATHSFKLSKELSTALNKLSQQQGTTLFMTLLAGFQTLLWRYTAQDDIVIGSPIANRNRAEIEVLIGFFVNTLVLRTNLAGNPSFEELLKQVREVALGAYAHQDLPFELLVEQLKIERNLSHAPLFQVMFVLQNAPMSVLELPGLTLSTLETDSGSSQFDLTLNITETEEELVGSLEYNTDLFEENTIQRMVGHLQTLLSGIVANPQQRLSELPLLTASEQHQLLVDWNDTRVEYSQYQCIHELFEAQVEKTPNAVAVAFEGEELTYQQLNCLANQLAHHLQSLGVGAEVLVGICLERSIDMVVSVLAVLKAGGAYVPLDPNYPQERLNYILNDAAVEILITKTSLIYRLPTNETKLVLIDGDRHSTATSCNPVNTTKPNNLAYVIYTSGSTGKPKATMIEHRGCVNHCYAMIDTLDLKNTDTIAQTAPIGFDISVWQTLTMLLVGGKVSVIKNEIIQDPTKFFEEIEVQEITVVQVVPSLLATMLDICDHWGTPQLSHLRWLSVTGEAFTANLMHWWFKYYPSIPLLNAYGPAECSDDVTLYPIRYGENPQLLNSHTIPIGKPIANIQIYILDSYLNPLPIGVAGELYVGGIGVGRGYLNRPQLTSEKFIQNPFSSNPEEKLYKTGDLGRYLNDGNIEFLGRIDNQVKIRGFRIETGEIEAVLATHPQVNQTVVIATEETSGNKCLVAYVVVDSEITTQQLREFLKAQLPEYMVPSAFITLESLPLTPNGKVDRKALPVTELKKVLSSNIAVPASTPIENLLVGVWAEVLGIEKVGIYDNFFTLGGHSLIATRVISKIRQIFQIELPLRCLFEKPTIEELAEEIEKVTLSEEAVNTTTIERIPRSQQLLLSFAQQRLWFLAQLEPNSPFYNISAAVRLEGQLNVEALQQSFNEIVHRHEALRTNFLSIEGQPVAVISEEKSLKLSILDISSLSGFQQEEELKQQATQEAQQPFDISRDHLLRVKLLRLDEQEHIVLLSMHHIISDDWSVSVFVQELATFYSQLCNGEPLTSAELPIQYVDFAAWQRQWLQGEVLETQISYWLKQLENAPKVLELTTDHPRPAIQTFRGTTYSFNLSKELSTALNKLSQQQGTTLFMTLFAGFQTLLWRYTGQEDIVVGSPIANRNRAEMEGLIGFFINTLVLRTNLAGNPSFEELLKRVREVTLGAYAHQDLPFELLVEQLKVERDLSHAPLFQVMFVLENAPMSALELPGLTLSALESDSGSAQFDLTLYIKETESGLVGNLEYNTDLFEENTIQRMVGHLQTLFEGIVTNPQQRLSELPILTESEQHQLLREWNNTEAEYPLLWVHELFEAQVEKTPNVVAVVFEEQQLTYRELNIKANQLARHLRSVGVKPEVRVGICVERSLLMVIGLLAILKAGGAYIPLDPSYPQERIAFILEETQAPVLLTQASLTETIPRHGGKVVCLDTEWHSIAQQSQDNLFLELAPENLAYIIYTSGSTGKPKGVQIPHIALINFLHSMKQAPGLTSEDILLAVTTYSFDIAALELFLPIIVGARVVIANREIVSDGMQLSAKLIDSNATVMQATPATWQNLLAAGWNGNRQLKILCGGEALPAPTASKLLERCDSLWNMYGPTETTIWSAASQVKTDSRLVTISQPIANTQLYILDKYNQLVPVGVVGELHIGGNGLARGYFHRGDITAEKFIPNPYAKNIGERLYKTGDLARYLPNGEIEYIGRVDYQVKLRGFRIELGEIEAVINQYPGVRESVVVLREDRINSQTLVAYVVPQVQQTVVIRELQELLGSNLPSYMIPGAFVTLERLPLTPNGKIDRKALPKPDLTLKSSANNLPSTPIEKLLAGIWIEVLGIDGVGVDQNFFDLGGHSLIATRVISQIRQVFQVEVALHSLFEKPTIAQLAEEIEKAIQVGLGTEKLHIERIERSPRLSPSLQLPLSFAQQRLWFLDQLEPNNPGYNIFHGVRIQGLLNMAALKQSFEAIVQRHEVLRTSFQTIDAQPIQIIVPNLDFSIPIIDLSEYSQEQQEQEIHRLAKQEVQKPFDLSQCPLLRVTALKLDIQEHIILLSMHHIVSDAWSMGILVEELTTLYPTFCTDKPLPLAELPIQYGDFAVWQRQWLQKDVLQTHLDYWKQQLGNTHPRLALPKPSKHSSIESNQGARELFSFSKDISEALDGLSRQQGVTLFMTLLAAFQVLLHCFTGTPDIRVGSPIANRNRVETEPLIGFFVNTLVLRIDLSGNPSFSELLMRSRRVTMDAYAHQDIPFEKLVEELQPERNLNHNPLYQAWFVLQNIPMPQLEIPGLNISSFEIETNIVRHDLLLEIDQNSQGLNGRFEYKTDLFDKNSISRLIEHFEKIIRCVVAEPEIKVNELAKILNQSDRKRQELKKQEIQATEHQKLKTIKRKRIHN